MTVDKEIIIRLRRGDRQALEDLYWTTHKELYGMAIRYLRDHHLAEDAVHDLFLKLWNARERLSDRKSLEGFMVVTLKNHVINKMKSEQSRISRQYEYVFETRNRQESEGTGESIDHKNLKEVLDRGMQQLPDRKKMIFELKRLEGYSNEEVAQKMDISVHTVKSQFYRANEFLKKYVKEEMEYNRFS